jgi:DNA-binding transcriptional LysR family regulator
MPELSALQVFLAVAAAGSLNAAAVELGVSQQAVSARIAALERQTGVALVSRTPRGSSLTPDGVVVSEWASRVLGVAGEMDEGLAALHREARRTLRIAASLTVAEYLLPAWLVALRSAAVQRKQPTVAVDLMVANSSAVVRHVLAEEVEVGLVEGRGVPKGLRHRTVGHDRLVVVVAPSHPWARRKAPPSAVELAATPIVAREPGSGTREVFDVALRRSLASSAPTEPIQSALELPTTAAIRAAVIAGAGPAVLSEVAVADDVAAGRLRVIDVEGLDLRRRLLAVWSGAAQPRPGPVRDLISVAVRSRTGSDRTGP